MEDGKDVCDFSSGSLHALLDSTVSVTYSIIVTKEGLIYESRRCGLLA